MRFRVLGGVEAEDPGGAPVDLGGRQPRILVAVLLAAGGRPVTADTLVDAIWGDDAPPSATGTLQSYVSRLRRRLAGSPARLLWDEAGYRLEVDAAHVDFRRFEAAADEGRALLDGGRTQEAAGVLRDAGALWNGAAFGELADLDAVRGLAVRLEERRLTALEDRLTAELAAGRHSGLVGEVTELVAAHPLRERLRELQALALYRSGRQADALRALADAARTLRDELGIEPSRPLRALEAAILAHDPALDLPASPAPVAGPASGGVAQPGGLVGRAEELATLVAVLDESAGDARFVVVEGDPGIGKTRLADELARVARERGAIAVWGRADEGGAAPALWPWLPPLRAVAEQAGNCAAPVLELLSGQGDATSPLEQFEAIAGVVDALTDRNHLVVLLDDLQWADHASLDLLGYLVRRAGPRLLVLGTVRRPELGRRDALTDTLATVARRTGSRRIQLRGLTQTETADLIAAAAGGPVDEKVAAVIHQRAEGNPFYAIELARLAGEEDAAGDVPGSVADVIRRRLGHLPPATVELLGVAAVVGRDVDIGLLARAAGMTADDCADTIEPAAVHRLLVAVPELPSVLRFSHALIREALLSDLSALRRARLHLRVADAIEAAGAGVDDAEILAEHLFQAASVGGAGRAAAALERAAEVAVRRVAYGAAEALLQRAVQLRRVTTSSSREGEDAELHAICRLIEIARARRYYAGAAELDVIDRAKELAERNGHHDTLLDLIWLEHAVAATVCDLDLAHRLARRLMALAGDDPDPMRRGKALLVWGVHCWQRGEITESVDHLSRGRQLYLDAAPVPVNDMQREQLMLAEVFHLFMAGISGALPADDVFAGYEQLAASVSDRFVLASVIGFESSAAVALGRWDVVERLVPRSKDVDPGTEFSFWTGLRTMHDALVLAWRGGVDEALTQFAEGRAMFTGIGSHSTLAAVEASLALHVAAAGRADDAARVAAGARDELETRGDRWSEPIVLMAEAAAAAVRGETEQAGAVLREAAAVAAAQGSPALADRAVALGARMGVDVVPPG